MWRFEPVRSAPRAFRLDFNEIDAPNVKFRCSEPGRIGLLLRTGVGYVLRVRWELDERFNHADRAI